MAKSWKIQWQNGINMKIELDIPDDLAQTVIDVIEYAVINIDRAVCNETEIKAIQYAETIVDKIRDNMTDGD